MPNRIRHRRVPVSVLALAVVAIPCSEMIMASAASASVLPNACSVLSSVQPQNTIGGAKHLAAGKLIPTTSTATDKGCSEAVGSFKVYLDLSKYAGGFGGVRITS